MPYIDKLAWIHIVDRKVLATLSKGKDTYYLPGGKREIGESDEQALLREIEEELTVKLLLPTLRSAGIFEAQAHGKPPGTIVRMTCFFGDYEGTLKANAEIEKLIWFMHDDRLKCSTVDVIIFDDLKKKNLID
jgi:8-oxo-dGTP diphosphatase